MSDKKTIVFHSNFSGSKTGFGRHTREILTALYKTGKYNLIEYATGLNWSSPETQRVPWKCFGVLPDTQEEIAYLYKDGQIDPSLARNIHYGSLYIDRLIKEEKPDIYVGVEDIWAFNGYWDRKWWNKINCVIHTTLDSLPILPQAIEPANKIKNYYVWAEFAEKELHRLGHEQVKTLHGAINTKSFFKLDDQTKRQLREKQNIDKKAFVIGFVFRNQLRKSVPNLIEGFKYFQQKNPSVKAYLLLHTSWEEPAEASWNIPRLIKDHDLSNDSILTTYICRRCRNYQIKPFNGIDSDCTFCGEKHNPHATKAEERRGQLTCGPNFGVTEKQLNEIYNLMDVYVHPFTSGGQEIPIQEAKLVELITLVTNYACGTEYSTLESGGMELSWSGYREPQTQFIKATTDPHSIVKNLTKVLNMSKEKKNELGKKARKFVENTCSVEVISEAYQEIFDAMPNIDWDFDFTEPLKNENYPIQNIKDDEMWIKDLYKNILLTEGDRTGIENWLQSLKDGISREKIHGYFTWVAKNDNIKNNPILMDKLFDTDDEGHRILYVMPQSLGDCFLSTALFESIKEMYPDYHLYIATKPEYFTVFQANPYVHKVIPYMSQMENEMQMSGFGSHKGVVDICLLPFILTQRQLNYLRNGKDKIAFNIKKSD